MQLPLGNLAKNLIDINNIDININMLRSDVVGQRVHLNHCDNKAYQCCPYQHIECGR